MRIRTVVTLTLGALFAASMFSLLSVAQAGGPGMQGFARMFLADDVVLKKGGETNLVIHADGDAATDDAAMKFKMNSTGAAVKFTVGVDAGDSDKFKIEAADGLGGATPAFVIQADGNVALGTTSATYQLTIAEDLNAANAILVNNEDAGTSARSAIWVSNDGNITGGMLMMGGTGYTGIAEWTDMVVLNSGSTASGLKIRAQNGGIGFSVDGGTDDDLYMDGSGNLGIGTTTVDQKLHLYGGEAFIEGDASDLIFRSVTTDDAGRNKILWQNNDVSVFAGDDAANQNFHFYPAFAATRTNDAVLKVFGSETSAWDNWVSLSHDGSDGVISTGAGDLNLNPSGNVGIGQAAPGLLLHVGADGTNGRMYLTGTSEGANPLTTTRPTNDNAQLIIGRNGTSDGGGIEFDLSPAGNGYGWKINAPDADSRQDLRFFNRHSSATWTEVMTIEGSSGDVGIGSTQPVSKLDVNGTITATAFSGALDPGTTTGSVLFDDGSGIGEDNSNLFWDDSNNQLGIGTSNPSEDLHVYAASGNINMEMESAGANSRVGYLATNDARSWRILVDGALTGDPLVIKDLTANATRVQIDETGNVGIGIDPTHVVHAEANSQVTTSGIGYFHNTATATPNGHVLTVEADHAFSQSNIDNTSLFRVRNSGGTVFGVDGDGQVAIGTTSPSALLTVVGDSATDLYPTVIRNDNTAAAATIIMSLKGMGTDSATHDMARIQSGKDQQWTATASTRDGWLSFHTREDNATAERLRITSSGNVGIGTTGPLGIVHTVGSSATFLNAFVGTNTDTAAAATTRLTLLGTGTDAVSNGVIRLVGGKEQEWTATASTRDSYMSFDTRLDNAMAERMRLTSSGNLGIGNSIPEAMLQVQMDTGASSGTFAAGYSPLIVDGDEARIQVRASDQGNWGAALHLTTATKTWSVFTEDDASYMHIGYDTQAADGENISDDSSQLMSFHTGGNVGIGTGTPSALLHVYGGNMKLEQDAARFVIRSVNQDNASRIGIDFDNNSIAVLEGDDHADQVFAFLANWSQTRTYDAEIRVYGAEASGLADYAYATHDGSNGTFGANQGNLYLLPATEKNVGIGTTTTRSKITFAGQITPVSDNLYDVGSASYRWDDVYATNGTINTSDRRMKKEIEPLGYGLSEVMNLSAVSYLWKDRDDGARHLGLIAQDVELVIPEVVDHGGGAEDRLGLRYSELVPVLIKAVQDQQAIIDGLEARLEALEAED